MQPIYTVTYGVSDNIDLDSNPFWHSFLLLSKYDEATNKMVVVENCAFGGVPATSPYPFVRKMKVRMGIDTDFYGNHGMFYPEEMRRLDRGKGLHGVTFELNDKKFRKLQARCNRMVADQNAAITEAASALKLQPLPEGKYRNYPYERDALRIYQYELQKAKEQRRQPRLHEFSICISSKSHTCKAQTLNLLYGIVTKEQFQRVSGWHQSIPRLSGIMENIYLHSTGNLHQHVRQSGAIANYRKNSDAQLYWSLPPQEFEALSEETRDLFKINPDHCDEVKFTIRQLQSLEWFFTDVVVADPLKDVKEKLIQQIIALYENFAVIKEKKSPGQANNWASFFRWMASVPRDADEADLLTNLNKAKHFIHCLYMAMGDEWKFASDASDNHPVDVAPAMSSDEPTALGEQSTQVPIDKTDYDLAILASYLTPTQQKELCKLLRKSYVPPDSGLDTSQTSKDSASLRPSI